MQGGAAGGGNGRIHTGTHTNARHMHLEFADTLRMVTPSYTNAR